MLIRPRWDVQEQVSDKLNLSMNVCVDSNLPEFNFDNTRYDDAALSYKILSEFHQVDTTHLAIGLGLSELICRIMYVVKLNGWSMHVSDIPTWEPVEALRIALGIPQGNDVVYVADPNGNNGNRGSQLSGYRLTIRDKSYADFMYDDKYDLSELTLKTLSKSIASPGVRFGWCIGPSNLIQQIQDIRPARVTIGGVGYELQGMLHEIPYHISRMNETKDYLESNYDCTPSLGNYVLFNSLPKWSERVIMKSVGGKYRMSLVDMDTFYTFGS